MYLTAYLTPKIRKGLRISSQTFYIISNDENNYNSIIVNQ